MIRGEIYFAELSSTIGSETNKKRPVVIVSNNKNNEFSETITIVPLTSNIEKIYPFEVFLPFNKTGLSKDSKAQCHQIRTISKHRMVNQSIGNLPLSEIQMIEEALKLHLDLW